MLRHRPTALAGIATGLLCNYWLLEWWLAERTDTRRSWISDLATRTEASGWRFQLLAILSGLAICALAVILLRRPVAVRQALPDRWRPAERGKLAWWGLVALLGVGVCATLAGAAPLSCPEGIEPGCTLAEDPGDVLHALATGGEILATVLAFGLLGLGLLRPAAGDRRPGQMATESSANPRGAGRITLAIGIVWLLLTAATGLAYLGGDLDAVKGILQRASQILFGTWLALLGWWFASESALDPEYREPGRPHERSEVPE